MRSELGLSVTAMSRTCTSSADGILIFFLFFLSVIESSHQTRRSLDTDIRTSGALVDGVERVTVLARSGERASLPARHSAVPAASGVTEHVGPPTGSGDVTSPGAGPPGTLSAGTATHLPTHSHPPGEFH